MRKGISKVCIAIFILLLSSDTFISKAQRVDNDYVLVFQDEFDGIDYAQPDTAKWGRSRRGWSSWNKWISRSEDVVYVRGGALVCRTIPNICEKSDTARMLTGAVETQDKFSFQYGKVEVRLRTNNHYGNFPAVWMMPQPPAPEHPYGGEIDIFEAFNSEGKAFQTVHSHWTMHLNKKKNPLHAFSNPVTLGEWHVYGFEWTANKLIWTVDGTVVGLYEKSKNEDDLANGQWPFDRPYYLILNQSVGSSGSKIDFKYIYETEFDWVRVYQKKD